MMAKVSERRNKSSFQIMFIHFALQRNALEDQFLFPFVRLFLEDEDALHAALTRFFSKQV